MRCPSNRQECQHPDQSFPKQNRLLCRREYLATTRNTKRHITRYFLVFIRPNRRGRPRLGIIVSKKVGKAVRRNHIKRRIREFFRLHKPWLPPSTDIVIIAKKDIPDITYKMACQDLEGFFKKASRAGTIRRRENKGRKG